MINCSESDFFNIISDNVKLPNFAKKNKNKDFALFGEANYRTKTIKIYDVKFHKVVGVNLLYYFAIVRLYS